MALHTEASGNLVATEFRAAIVALGIAQTRVAELFDVGPRSVRRWQRGDRRVPRGVGIVLRLLAAGTVTIDQIEQVAVPVSAGRTAKRSLRLAVKTPALAAVAATLADSGLTTAEKVFALAGACRWPHGDPQRSDFYFLRRSSDRDALLHAPPQRGLHDVIVVSSAPGGRLLLAHAQLHHLGRLTADDFVHTIGPALQSDTDVVGIIVPWIDASNAAEDAALMIERLLDHRHLDAELLHASGRGSAQVMQTPSLRGDPRPGADPALDLTPAVHRSFTLSAEHVRTAGELRASFDQRPGLRTQRDFMLAAVLGSLSWQCPNTVVDLGPFHPTDLVAARAREDQHPNGLAERTIMLAGEPHRAQFGIAENSFPNLFLVRGLDPGDGRERERVAGDQPVEEFRERSKGPVNAIAATVDGDGLDELDDVAPADTGDRTTTPGWQDDVIKNALGGPSMRDAVLAADIELEKRGRRRLDLVPTPPPFWA